MVEAVKMMKTSAHPYGFPTLGAVALRAPDASAQSSADDLRLHCDATETALVVLALLVREWPRRAQVLFDPAHRLMAAESRLS
jgi:hypothetical protein